MHIKQLAPNWYMAQGQTPQGALYQGYGSTIDTAIIDALKDLKLIQSL